MRQKPYSDSKIDLGQNFLAEGFLVFTATRFVLLPRSLLRCFIRLFPLLYSLYNTHVSLPFPLHLVFVYI